VFQVLPVGVHVFVVSVLVDQTFEIVSISGEKCRQNILASWRPAHRPSAG
jgi:hypothetical protein